MPIVNEGVQKVFTAIKESDESITSDDTLTGDTDLRINLEKNKKYSIEMAIFVEQTVNGGFNWDIADFVDGVIEKKTGGETWRDFIDDIGFATGVDTTINISATLETGDTLDNVVFRWAQLTSSVDATILKAGSWIRIVEVIS